MTSVPHLASPFHSEVHLRLPAGALALLLVAAEISSAQQDSPSNRISSATPVAGSPASIAPASPTAVPHTLQNGTAIKLKLTETLTSASAKVGQKVAFQVVEEVDVDGVPVIAKGAQALGTVTTAEPK